MQLGQEKVILNCYVFKSEATKMSLENNRKVKRISKTMGEMDANNVDEISTLQNGLQKQLSKVRRPDRGHQEELVPLALSADDSHDVTLDGAVMDNDAFETPSTPEIADDYANGDLYKEKIRDDQDDAETRCGYWQCRPDALQKCNNPKALLMFLCCFSMAQGFVVNGINNVNTSSVERRFQLPSSRVGMISSSYDFSAAILGVFISFMGSGRQKAKWLTMAAVTMAIGSFVMALPHFTSGTYEWGQNVVSSCRAEVAPETCNSESDLQHYLYVLILGQLLHGLGGTTLYTVGVALIDDSVSASSSPMYIGILYAFATLGPALGYIIGGRLLDVYVDFDQIATSEISITPEDPRWVGAWWVGFLVASILFLVAAIPISMYGAELPSAKHVRETRVSQTHGDDGTMVTAISSTTRSLSDLRHLPASLYQLLKVPPFMFITFAGATEGMITSGFATFMPKFIQNQFGVTAGWASMLTGFMAVPGAGGGQFFGGVLCKKLNLKVKGCIRVAIICCVLTIFISASMWAKCDLINFAGVSTHYSNSSSTLPELSSECNSGCNCHTELYEPVCDTARGVQYFSPCHAGCQTSDEKGNTFTNCSCVVPTQANNNTMVTMGKCGSECGTLYIFLPLIFIAIFLMFTPSPPAVAATLRCIHDSQRTLGLGMKWLIVRLLGTVPGPILFGAIIDSTCMVWREKCGEQASCWIYDNANLSRNFFVLVVSFKIVSIIFFAIAHQTYKPPTEKGVKYNVEDGSIRTESVSSAMTAISDNHKE